MAWVDGLHIGSVVGPEAKQKDTRYPYPYRAVQRALCTGRGRAGQVRTPTPLPPVPLPPGPGLHPCQHLVWEGSQGVPGQPSAVQVARSLDCWRGTRETRRGGGGMEAIDGTEHGSFAREGCPALGPRLASAWPTHAQSEFRAQALPLS